MQAHVVLARPDRVYLGFEEDRKGTSSPGVNRALFDGVAQYQRSLKNVRTVAVAPIR